MGKILLKKKKKKKKWDNSKIVTPLCIKTKGGKRAEQNVNEKHAVYFEDHKI